MTLGKFEQLRHLGAIHGSDCNRCRGPGITGDDLCPQLVNCHAISTVPFVPFVHSTESTGKLRLRAKEKRCIEGVAHPKVPPLLYLPFPPHRDVPHEAADVCCAAVASSYFAVAEGIHPLPARGYPSVRHCIVNECLIVALWQGFLRFSAPDISFRPGFAFRSIVLSTAKI